MIESLTLKAQEESLSNLIMNIRQAILNAHKVLSKNQIKSAGIDCEILLSKVLKDRKYVILNSDKELNEKNISDLKDLIIKRSLSEPVHI